MENRIETALALFGIVRAGAVAVPLNVSITDAAVAGMCADAGCVAVFASGAHCARIDALRAARRSAPATSSAAIRPRRVGSSSRRCSRRSRAAAPRGRDRAGRRVQHHLQLRAPRPCRRGSCTRTPAACTGPTTARSRCATAAAAARCARSACSRTSAGCAMLATILVGGTIVLLRHFSPRDALALIEAERITHGAFVPVQLERMLADPERREFRTASLETLMCCGSPLAPAGQARLRARVRLPAHRALRADRGPDHDPRSPRTSSASSRRSASRCWAPTSASSATTTARRRPGETGEIVGCGALVMAGYHGRDDANGEATWIDAAGPQMASNRRPRAARCGGLPLYRRPQEGHDPVRAARTSIPPTSRA